MLSLTIVANLESWGVLRVLVVLGFLISWSKLTATARRSARRLTPWWSIYMKARRASFAASQSNWGGGEWVKIWVNNSCLLGDNNKKRDSQSNSESVLSLLTNNNSSPTSWGEYSRWRGDSRWQYRRLKPSPRILGRVPDCFYFICLSGRRSDGCGWGWSRGQMNIFPARRFS